MKQVTLIDYGSANILNVVRAFEYLGAETKVVNTPLEINNADRIVIPGVGAFDDCMNALKKSGFADTIYQFVLAEKPLLLLSLLIFYLDHNQ